MVLAVDRGASRLNCGIDDTRQCDALHPERQISLGNAANIEKILEQLRHPFGLPLDDLPRPLRLFGLQFGGRQEVRRRLNGRERTS